MQTMTSLNMNFSLLRFVRLCCVMLSAIFFIPACGGGAGSVGIATSVALYTTAPSAITITVGAVSYSIGGGTPTYSVSSSNPSVVTVSIANSSTLNIVGVAAGTAQVIVRDAAGTTVTISVTISGSGGGTSDTLFTTSPSAITVNISSAGSFMVSGGTVPYTASSSNAAVATASISGTTLTVGGSSAGTADVLVFDATGASVTIAVTVPAAGSPTSIAVQPSGATGNVGDVLTFLISGGSPTYRVTVNNASIVSASPTTGIANGGSFTATLLNAGSTSLTIVDAAGQVTSLTVTVNQFSSLLRISPSALLIGEDSVSNISLNIFGGIAPYTAFTSDLTLSSVSVTGSVLTVGLGSSPNRCINPIDSSGTRVPNGTFDVTLTVTDSLGASATSILTIKDNGVGTGIVVTQPFPFVAPCG